MRKIIFVAMAAIVAVLASCGDKVQRAALVDNLYAEQVTNDDGSTAYALVAENDGKYINCSLLDEVYTKIEYHKPSGLIFAYKGADFFIYDGSTQLGSHEVGYNGITQAPEGFYFTNNEGISLYTPKNKYLFGPYEKITIVGDKLFVKGPKGWGLLDFDYNYLQERLYEKLYIINQKNSKEYEVLRLRDGKWSMVSADEAEWDQESANQVVKELQTKFKPDQPVGVIDLKL